MRRAHRVNVRACSFLAGRCGAWITSLALVAMVWLASPAWGQAYWPNYPYNTAISVATSGYVGIGTAAPAGLLHLRSYIPALVLEDPYTGTRWGKVDTYLNFIRIGQLNVSDLMVINMDSGNVGIGIGTNYPQYKLAVKGTIGAQDVIVTNTGWPDYVFRPGYRLRSLSEVSAYIQRHHHLPDIPTEAEVKEKGASVSDMQAKLLTKIEELTLHMIRQEKEKKDLRERLAQLETRVAASGGVASGR